MQKTLEQAKTLRAEFEIRSEQRGHCAGMEPNVYTMRGKLLWEEGAKVRLALASSSGTGEMVCVSDGKRLYRAIPNHEKEVVESPAAFDEIVTTLLLRGRIEFLFGVAEDWARHGGAPKDRYSIKGIGLLDNEAIGDVSAKVVRLHVSWKLERTDNVCLTDRTIWIHPTKYVPIKIVEEMGRDRTEFRFSTFEIDSQIGANEFKIEK